MRNEQNFINEINHGQVALEADLRCNCGSKLFHISHSGNVHKGFFGGISILRKNNQLLIQCACANCGWQYHLYNSTKDGTSPQNVPVDPCVPLSIKEETTFQIKLRYNFMKENFKTDQFEMFFLDVKLPDSKKYITICEL